MFVIITFYLHQACPLLQFFGGNLGINLAGFLPLVSELAIALLSLSFYYHHQNIVEFIIMIMKIYYQREKDILIDICISYYDSKPSTSKVNFGQRQTN